MLIENLKIIQKSNAEFCSQIIYSDAAQIKIEKSKWYSSKLKSKYSFRVYVNYMYEDKHYETVSLFSTFAQAAKYAEEIFGPRNSTMKSNNASIPMDKRYII